MENLIIEKIFEDRINKEEEIAFAIAYNIAVDENAEETDATGVREKYRNKKLKDIRNFFSHYYQKKNVF